MVAPVRNILSSGAGPKYPVKPAQYSAVVFLSHDVESIEFLPNAAKGRHMWANELWALNDPPFGVLRPTLESMEHFLELQQQSQQHAFPQPIETGAWLLEQGRELLVDGKDAPEYYQDDDDEDEEASQDEDEDEDEEESQDDEENRDDATEL